MQKAHCRAGLHWAHPAGYMRPYMARVRRARPPRRFRGISRGVVGAAA